MAKITNMRLLKDVYTEPYTEQHSCILLLIQFGYVNRLFNERIMKLM